MYRNVKINHSTIAANAEKAKLHSFLSRPLPLLLRCVLIAALLAGCSTSDTVRAPRKAIFIILDGIPADVIESQETPALDEIASRGGYARSFRSEEHTSELQSRENLVCRLLLEKKNP